MIFRNQKILLFFSLFFFLTIHNLCGQIGTKKKKLVTIFNEIKNSSGFSFSYLDREVKDIKVSVPLPDKSNIEVILQYLKEATQLNFKILPNKIIAVYTSKEKVTVRCGQVMDSYQQPIKAIVRGNEFTKVANDQGVFKFIETDLKEQLTISAPGYVTKRLLAQQFSIDSCKKVVLRPAPLNLDEVIITNYLVKGIFKNADGSISLDYSDFGILPGLTEPDLLQTLQSLPGITSANETISDVNIRGGTRDQNLIVWDGIKMYQFSHFFGLISTFNPYLTKNVRLYKNGTDASYGDGVSGVIEMNTSNTIQQDLTASAGINLISSDVYIDTPISKKASLQIALRRSLNDLVKTPTYEQFFEKAFQDTEVVDMNNSDISFSFWDASIRGLFQIGRKDVLKINGILMEDDLIFKENNIGGNEIMTRESGIFQNNYAAGISHIRNWTDKWKSEILLYGSNYTLMSNNSDIINNQNLLQENEVLENGIKATIHHTFTEKIEIKAGYQFNETGIRNLRNINNPTFIEQEKNVLRTQSAFSEIGFSSLNKRTIVSAGMRANFIQKLNETLIEPRISFQQKMGERFTLEVLGELKSQTTTQVIDFQNDFLGVENRKWIVSNNNSSTSQNVPILNSRQLSFGFQYNTTNFLFQTDTYYKHVSGIITRSQGFLNQYEFVNDVGDYEVRGLDFLITKKFKNVNTWMGYTYSENDYTFSNLDVSSFPNNIDIRHQINIAAAYSNKKLSVSSGLTWRTGIPTTLPVSNTVTNNNLSFQFPNADRIDDYLRIDMSATYNFRISPKMKSLLGFSLWNVFSRNNSTNKYFRLSENNEVLKIEEKGLGITPNLVFRIIF